MPDSPTRPLLASALAAAFLSTSFCAELSAQSTKGNDPLPSFIESEVDSLVELYRHFHRNPELSFREVKTSERFASELEAAGFEVTTKVGGLGVVGVLKNGDGPVVMFRADMDALPIGEQTGLPYASKVRIESPDGRVAGSMHACGHDVHMTNALGTARFFGRHRETWSGTLVFIGQPAEERSGGARPMLEDGLYTRFPRPDAALAMHVTHEYETGHVALRAGPAMANVESVDIEFKGRGGHGAAPHTTIDPVVIAARFIVDAQTIVSRELNPTDDAVITVGAIEGGTKHNIIGDRCNLQLTIRSYTNEVHEKLREALHRKANAAALSSGAPEPELSFSEFTPALINDASVHDRVRKAFEQDLGADAVHEAALVMTAEDFGLYGRAGVPILMFRVGTIAPDRMKELEQRNQPIPPLHSAFYYPDAEPSLRTSIRATVTAIRAMLAR